MTFRSAAIASCAAALLITRTAEAVPIDLNEFFYFPDSPVTIAADGSSALLAEDPASASVILSNDPGLDDPELIVPGVGAILSFDYAFTLAAGGVDEFLAFLFDVDAERFDGDGNLLSLASWSCIVTCASSASIDLSAFTSLTLGLEFQLSSIPPDDFDLGSTLWIGNLDLSQQPVSVPEPPTLALFAAGIFAGWFARRRKTAANRQGSAAAEAA